jgi:predicted  nucleic acid-binding Zn-ribbon protein
MDKNSQLILLASNVEKLEKLLDDLADNVESKRKKIRFLKDQIETNIQKIDQIIGETNADS